MDSANVGESKTTNNTTSNNEQNDRKENRGNSTNNPVKNQNNSNRGRKSQKRKDESTDDNMNKKFTRNRKWDGKTRRDKNVDTRPAEEVEEGEKEERRPKKKVACFIGYSGEGYHGMQFNGSMKTIEKDIYDAFAKAGAILKANASDPGKSSLQRAARTDKGVHAAGNLISLKMMIGDNPDELAQKINEHLPPQIRIYGIQRANNAFNSHIHCDSRVYEYIIPSHCFLPPKPGSTASTYARSIESQGREAEPEDTFWDNVVGPDFYSLLQRQISQKRDPPEDRLPELSSEESSRLQKMKADETEAIRSFRLSPSRLSRIRSAFNVYLGTHNFHNLTIGVPVHSSHAQRYIMSINIAEPKIYGSTEWLRIKIHGQSFMLHQIRKMIGAVLMAIRYGVGEESIRQILTTRADMHIPKAPAQGLLLERPVFTGISEKIKKFGNEALDWKPYEEKIEKFKEDFIYKSIFREITAENIFHEFINFMDSFKYDEKEGLAMIAQRPTVESVETFERDEEDEKDIRGDSEQAVAAGDFHLKFSTAALQKFSSSTVSPPRRGYNSILPETMVFILAETAAGYAVFKAKDKALKNPKSLDLDSVENATSILRLKLFEKFENTADALDNAAALVEGKVAPKLANLLKSLDEKSGSLIVSDPKLGASISQIPKLGFEIVADSSTVDIYRAIRTHMASLIPDLLPNDLHQMSLGLSHSLSRHKLKFSPDKIDTMIVQAIGLLDDLDKELNTYAMRTKEWYGWHFPEMGKIVTDNLAYAKVIKTMGFRTNAADTDFSEILPEDVSTALQTAAEVSMGTEISQSDLDNILLLVDQVISLTEYRAQLYNYLGSRMRAIAPNLTTLVGELVGARLIAHAGNLVNLAKQPASTIQILGAEKALFRALKTKHDTPKYGLIFHASLVGQASMKNKGKIARSLAAKSALATRYDSLLGVTTRSGDSANVEMEEIAVDGPTVAIKYREKIERRLRTLEGRLDGTVSRSATKQQKKFEFTNAPTYNADADVPMTEADLSPLLSKGSPEPKKKKDKKEKKDKSEKKEKKRSRKEMEEEEDEVEEKLVQQAKSNGVEESAEVKKHKDKSKKDKGEKEKKKRKISEAEEAVEKTVETDGLSEKARRKLEKKLAKQEARAAKKARNE